MSSSEQRRRGAALSIIALVINLVLSIFYLPILIEYLPNNAYGIFELGAGLILWFAMLDLGLAASVSRFYSLWREERPEYLPSLLSTSAVIYLTLLLLTAAVALYAQLNVNSIFKETMSAEELSQIRTIILLVVINTAFTLPTSWLSGLLNAIEEFTFVRTLLIVRSLILFLIVAVVAAIFHNPVLALAGHVAVSLFVFIATLVFVLKSNNINLVFGRPRISVFTQLFRFSSLVAIIIIFDLVFWRTGQIILAAVSGPLAVAAYAIVVRIITSVFMPLSTGLSSVFLAHLTRIFSTPNYNVEVNRLFVKVGRLQSIIIWAFIGLYICCGQLGLNLWLGSEYEVVYPSTLVLLLSLSFSSIQTLSTPILQAKNRLGFKASVFSVLLILFLLLSVPIATRFGVLGLALLGASLLFFGTGPIMNWYFYFKLNLDIPTFFREVYRVPLYSSASSFLSILMVNFTSVGNTLVGFALNAVIFACFYSTIIFGIYMNTEEKLLMRTLLRLLGR